MLQATSATNQSQGATMTRASIFKNGSNQAIRLPREMELQDVTEVELRREGESIVITPVRKNWSSFASVEPADEHFLDQRESLMDTQGAKL
jgi:antitoxin VapB